MWVLKTINKISQISILNMKHSLNQKLEFQLQKLNKRNIFEMGKKKTFKIETIEVDNNYYDKK